jgi:hypothetical protein
VRIRPQVALPLLALCFAGCSDSSAPKNRTNRLYSLETIDGHALPVIVVGDASSGTRVVFDTLALDFNQDTAREILHSQSYSSGVASVDRNDTTSLLFNVDGDSILFLPLICGAECIGRTGRLDASSMTLKSTSDASPNPEYAYRLVPASP